MPTATQRVRGGMLEEDTLMRHATRLHSGVHFTLERPRLGVIHKTRTSYIAALQHQDLRVGIVFRLHDILGQNKAFKIDDISIQGKIDNSKGVDDLVNDGLLLAYSNDLRYSAY